MNCEIIFSGQYNEFNTVKLVSFRGQDTTQCWKKAAEHFGDEIFDKVKHLYTAYFMTSDGTFSLSAAPSTQYQWRDGDATKKEVEEQYKKLEASYNKLLSDVEKGIVNILAPKTLMPGEATRFSEATAASMMRARIERDKANSCRCDIKDLMSSGHTPNCLEKK